MCGITGFLVNNWKTGLDKVLEEMTETISHRGPDSSGYFISEADGLGFGHRRLSIIDLDTGDQPITTRDGRYSIIYNGEVYNFQEIREELKKEGRIFRTESDTEVVLEGFAQWGTEILKKLRGMFCFAIWDNKEKEIFIARDKFGIKPVYYFHKDGVFVFSSEIKSILKFPGLERATDLQSAYEFMTYRYVPGPKTLFKNIFSVNPGSFLKINHNSVKEHKYWDISEADIKEKSTGSLQTMCDRLYDLLSDSVKVRLISDVPLGAFLSGGLDSSMIVALMSSMTDRPVKTFSVGFGETGEYSELDYARIVADRFKTDHHEVVVSFNDVVDLIENISYFRDTPVSEPADIPVYLVSKLARENVKVVLSGEGSDEIFGGYPKYAFDDLHRFLGFLPAGLKAFIRKRLLDNLPYRFRRIKIAGKSLLTDDPSERFVRWFGASFQDDAGLLLSDEFINAISHETVYDSVRKVIERYAGLPELDRMALADIKTWLPDNLLLRGDKMTMACSLEMRVPFLDPSVVLFALKTKRTMRVKRFTGKYILKKTAERILPKQIIYRKKRGFPVPIGLWFRTHLKDYVKEILLSKQCLDRGYFNGAYMKTIIDDHVCGRRDYQKEIWMLLNFEIWHRRFID